MGKSKLDASQSSISSSRLAAINAAFVPDWILESAEVAQSLQPARVTSKIVNEINKIKRSRLNIITSNEVVRSIFEIRLRLTRRYVLKGSMPLIIRL